MSSSSFSVSARPSQLHSAPVSRHRRTMTTYLPRFARYLRNKAMLPAHGHPVNLRHWRQQAASNKQQGTSNKEQGLAPPPKACSQFPVPSSLFLVPGSPFPAQGSQGAFGV